MFRNITFAIVASGGRKKYLSDAVHSIREALGATSPILIIENAPDLVADDVGMIANMVVIRSNNLSPAAARNLALRSAKTEWIFFLDDDARLPLDFGAKFCLALDEITDRPQLVAMGGPNLSPPEADAWSMAIGQVLASRLATYFSYRRYRATGERMSCGDESLTTCNLLVRTSFIRRYGIRFNSNLECAEENHFMEQIRNHGGSLFFDSRLAVWHHRRADLVSFYRQIFKYGKGRFQATCLSPSSVRWPHVLPAALIFVGLLMLVFSAKTAWLIPLYFGILGVHILCARINSRALVLFPIIHFGYGMGFLYGFAQLFNFLNSAAKAGTTVNKSPTIP